MGSGGGGASAGAPWARRMLATSQTYAAELTDAEKRYVAAFRHMNYPKVIATTQPSLAGDSAGNRPTAVLRRRPHAGARIDYTCVLYALFTAAPTMAPRGQCLSGTARPAPYRFLEYARLSVSLLQSRSLLCAARYQGRALQNHTGRAGDVHAALLLLSHTLVISASYKMIPCSLRLELASLHVQ
jgi:hypothetical protein